MASLPITYTNAPNIVVTVATTYPIDIGTQKGVALGEVVSMYLNCYLYSVGDILLYETEGAVRYVYGNIPYFVISTDSVKVVYRAGSLS